ncbi:hypothetical protein PR202_ga00662 [Eleusine coracana subsp. coracana]|uniref:Uncharacterized protein n=1 Tax=Eleusine coracana subsp. coracana TaxID=191504 RepID=A0AAV5BEG1_ELECO|nr:hypothetical protein PR202_ga00662 [Eleusine coracana subsp. coracana]
MASRLRPSTHRASLVSVLLVLLVSSSTVTATATATVPEQYRTRKLLVTAPRVSPETTSLTGAQQEQEMDVGGWRTSTPFEGAGASLGRKIPGSHANPKHN